MCIYIEYSSLAYQTTHCIFHDSFFCVSLMLSNAVITTFIGISFTLNTAVWHIKIHICIFHTNPVGLLPLAKNAQHSSSWRAGASQPSRANGTIFLYVCMLSAVCPLTVMFYVSSNFTHPSTTSMLYTALRLSWILKEMCASVALRKAERPGSSGWQGTELDSESVVLRRLRKLVSVG